MAAYLSLTRRTRASADSSVSQNETQRSPEKKEGRDSEIQSTLPVAFDIHHPISFRTQTACPSLTASLRAFGGGKMSGGRHFSRRDTNTAV